VAVLAQNFKRPWLAWMALVLCRQRARQAFANDVSERLSAFGGPDHGDVPWMPGWHFEFHGKGFALHAPDGEVIDLDFYGDHGATIDPYFFADRVMSLRIDCHPETQLKRWAGTRDLIVAALDLAQDEGLIHRNGHCFKLSPELESHHAVVAERGLAIAAMDPANDAEHRAWLMSLLDRHNAACFRAVAAAARQDVIARLPALLFELDAFAADALDWCRENDIDVEAYAARLLKNAKVEEDHPHRVVAAAHYLLPRPGHRDRALRALHAVALLEKVNGYSAHPALDEVAFLLLEYDHAHALPVLRRALRQGVPFGIRRVIALLRLVDFDWCRRELDGVPDMVAWSSAPDAEVQALAQQLRARQLQL
jgi:hypothetical protein